VCFSLLHDAGVLKDALASYALIATVTRGDLLGKYSRRSKQMLRPPDT
jgi:hypothetical protein